MKEERISSLLSVIFPPHLLSVCFRSPSNSSLEAFSALLCSCLFLFAPPSPLPPYTRNPLFKHPFLPVDALSSELLLIFFPLSRLRLIYLYLLHSSLPLLFLFTSHFPFPALLLSPSIISLYSWSIFLSHEHFSLSLILLFLFTYLVSGRLFSRFSGDELFSWVWIRPEALILLQQWDTDNIQC